MSAQTDAQVALFERIKAVSEQLATAQALSAPAKASTLRDLALAYRLTAGGPQPGGMGQ